MEEKSKEEFKVKVCAVNRCTKVVKGGRRFSFSAIVLIGDGNKRGGWGFAKARTLVDAIRKAEHHARRQMFVAPMVKKTVPLGAFVKKDSVRLMVKSARPGTGLVAGRNIKMFLQLLGYEDIVVKNFGGNNVMNQIRAIHEALISIGDSVVLAKTRKPEMVLEQ